MATEGGKLFAGRIPRGKLDPRFGTALHCGGYMLAGFVTACARVLASGAPFGMAFVAAAGPGVKGVFALAGVALGYLLSGGIDWGIRYIAAAVLVYTVGFVFQAPTLLDWLSALDNVLLPLRFAPERRARVREPRAAALGLTDALGLPRAAVEGGRAGALSVGQQQRVAVARALIGAPPLIVADEPTSALDAATQGAFLDLLFAQAEAAGTTLLMVSHDERLAQRFDRTLRMEDVVQPGREAAA